jgi:hypothetical protein
MPKTKYLVSTVVPDLQMAFDIISRLVEEGKTVAIEPIIAVNDDDVVDEPDELEIIDADVVDVIDQSLVP